ncbi:metallophosphoesterase [Brenneria goodwinii]|uniref:metallophosphoesterase n=1 Tax=Brenneria goodwinii TaxID=1109412 RepID=UPI0036EF8ACB
MRRRQFLQLAGAIFLASRATAALSETPTASQLTRPESGKQLLKFGLVTDIHYADNDTYGAPGEEFYEVYRHALPKFRQVVDLFNTQSLDFAIELGDFKDCVSPQNHEQTIGFLKQVEGEFAKFKGDRYHVVGNHDFDAISPQDFLACTQNAGDANGKLYYTFVKNGVRFIVLDACYTDAKGEGVHFSHNNFTWDIANIPDEEIDWLRAVLKSDDKPIVVFTHQTLDYFDPEMAKAKVIVQNAEPVVKALEDSGRVLAVFSGHHHPGRYNFRNGIHYFTTKALVEWPLPHNACAIVTIDKDLNIYVEGMYDAVSRQLNKAHA